MFLVSAGGLMLIVGVLFWRAIVRDEPSHGGVLLSLSLENVTHGVAVMVDYPPEPAPEAKRAAEAFKEMGSKAIPYLITVLKARHGRFERQLRSVLSRKPFWQIELADASLKSHAAYAFGTIGSAAKAAVPQLSKLLMDSDASIRLATARALGCMRENGNEAVPSLVVSLGDSDKSVRAASAWALGEVGPKPDAAVRALALALDDPFWEVRYYACLSLSKFDREAAIAVPKLLNLTNDSAVSQVALRALIAIRR